MIALIIFAIPTILGALAIIRQVFVDDEVHWKEGMI
jgi:hypothetical protein